ncbi:MAG: hypothetical protein ACE5R6_18165 [Candidatus Heimdallarchaeota archaeon]
MRDNRKPSKIALLGIALVLIMVSAVIASAVPNGSVIQGNEEENLVIVESTYNNIDYVFKVTGKGNVPHYHFYEKADGELEPADVSFHVKFIQLIEFNDINDDGFDAGEQVPGGGHMLALPSVDWNYKIDTAAKIFNFTTPEGSTPWVRLVNHYDVANELKFDIELRDWDWLRDDSELALRFDVTANPEPEIDPEDVVALATSKGVRFDYGDDKTAFFNSSTEAEITTESGTSTQTVKIKVRIMDEDDDIGASVYLSYPHFTKLSHDPTVGFGDRSAVSEFPILQTSLFIVGMATIGILGILVIRRRY